MIPIVYTVSVYKLHISSHISHFSLAMSGHVFFQCYENERDSEGLHSFHKNVGLLRLSQFITVKFVDNVELFCLCNKTRANCLHFLFSSLYFENVENFESVCGRVWECVCVLMNKHVCTYLLYVGVLMTICMLSTYVLWSATELLLYLLLLSRFTFHICTGSQGCRTVCNISKTSQTHNRDCSTSTSCKTFEPHILALLNFLNIRRESLSQIWKREVG